MALFDVQYVPHGTNYEQSAYAHLIDSGEQNTATSSERLRINNGVQ